MLDEDLEQFLLGFDAIRSAQAVPKRWSKSWDDRLKRGHEVRHPRVSCMRNYGNCHRNDVASVLLRLSQPLAFDIHGTRDKRYSQSRDHPQRMFFFPLFCLYSFV